LRDDHADLAGSGRTGSKDLEQSGSSRDAEDQAEGEEDEFGSGHAIRIGRFGPLRIDEVPPAQRSCEGCERQIA
jgi:hypothetical protein